MIVVVASNSQFVNFATIVRRVLIIINYCKCVWIKNKSSTSKNIIIRLVKRGILIFLIKILSSVAFESYTAIKVENSMEFYTVYQAAIMAVLFVNSILFFLLIYFGWRVYGEIREKSTFIQTSPDGFRMMEQLSAIQQQEKSLKKDEIKNPTPDQPELEDKGSINISINENMSPAMLKLKSSLSPSPGKYRSGKILDFLEKKISHAKHSQKELSNGFSREFNKKFNTDQCTIDLIIKVQISLDFGDQEDVSSARNPIDVEIQKHNFSKDVKFIS
ncbi:unnamed protein product (macronuclear) [Paramecium tetraurelia]|uniref:Uncharacterized protein n=1 Tax=Paramecium tetraurelia TaxID=5888 RepID=A0BU31_PARTE|nr:uncharacterized protein GSPATT00032280001 [Paramecium tetraurelia]CAK62048.1 unnamed protein product [Paramecium tetraurelia]|eukprot:XP_001429446.1 hypothetical protein (macronuclear) [Paramecium tetraurelia strain d4-2]